MFNKIPVAVLGATGCVGQKMVQLLSIHPWFQIIALCASERSVGKAYGEVVNWLMSVPLDENIARMEIRSCIPNLDCPLVFSGLDSSIAGEVELAFAAAGYFVISNASNHRMDDDVPLLIGEVNSDHLSLLNNLSSTKGKIIKNPNCSVIGLSLALKPLLDHFGIESIHIVTLQALSGAGYPGVSSLDITDNVIPYIAGEEAKVESEPLKILGQIDVEGAQSAMVIHHRIRSADFKISAQCNRVPVSDGHLACISAKLKYRPKPEEMIAVWREFSSLPQSLQLPSAPLRPIYYFDLPHHPQPRLHRLLDKEMAVSIGGLRPCSLFDYKFSLLSHNTMRGAAGASLLNAELLVASGKYL